MNCLPPGACAPVFILADNLKDAYWWPVPTDAKPPTASGVGWTRRTKQQRPTPQRQRPRDGSSRGLFICPINSEPRLSAFNDKLHRNHYAAAGTYGRPSRIALIRPRIRCTSTMIIYNVGIPISVSTVANIRPAAIEIPIGIRNFA